MLMERTNYSKSITCNKTTIANVASANRLACGFRNGTIVDTTYTTRATTTATKNPVKICIFSSFLNYFLKLGLDQSIFGLNFALLILSGATYPAHEESLVMPVRWCLDLVLHPSKQPSLILLLIVLF